MNCCRVSVRRVSSLFCYRSMVSSELVNLFTSCSAVQTSDLCEEVASHDSYYSELKHRVAAYATEGCIREALETMNLMRVVPGKPNLHDYNALIRSLLKSNNVLFDVLFNVYADMRRFGPYPSAMTYNILLNGLLSRGIMTHVVVIAEEMWGSGFLPSFSMMSKMLKRLLGSGYLADALSVFKFMLRLNYFPTDSTLNRLIVFLSDAGMITDAFFVLCETVDRGYVRGAYNYNPILWALCRSGQSYTALVLFYSLKKRGFAHDVRSYTALVYGFSRERLWEEVLRCLYEMETVSCKPNVITYTTIIKFLCDDGKIEKALEILNKMEKAGLKPDIVTYNILLRELCQQSKINELVELFWVIDHKGLSPDLFTHAALAGGLLKGGKIQFAAEILLEFISRARAVDVAIYNIYFHILCHRCKPNDVWSKMKSMIKLGFKPNTISYNTILKALSNDKIDEALQLFDHIDWGVNGPDLVSFNTILSAACKQGNSSMLRRIMYRMEYEGLKLNTIGSTCLIHYFCEVGKIPDCIKLLDYMVANDLNLTLVTFNILIKGLCKNRLLKEAYGIVGYMKSTGFVPDTITYKVLLSTSIREHDFQLIDQLLRDMRSEKLEHDNFTLASIIYGLCKKSKISLALKLQDLMIENGITPGIGIYNSIMRALLKRGKFSDVKMLLKKMVMEGCEPNAASFDILNREKSKGWLKGLPKTAKNLELVMLLGKKEICDMTTLAS